MNVSGIKVAVEVAADLLRLSHQQPELEDAIRSSLNVAPNLDIVSLITLFASKLFSFIYSSSLTYFRK